MSEKRVLIVDDSKDIGRMIAAALGTLDPGVQVKMMSSAEEAVLEITRQSYDLLVIDIRLPGISGLDLTRRIRTRNPNLKIIQISGLDDPQLPKEATQAGANAFFHKPISMSEFLRTTAVFLGLRTAAAEVEVASEFRAEAQSGSMADVFSATRKALNALSVMMMDGRGHVVIQAGKLPDPNLEFSLAPDLIEALIASGKVGVRLGETQPGQVLTFKGPAFHVLAAPIFDGYALVIFLQAERPALRMAIALEEAQEAQAQLYRLIQAGHPVVAQPAQYSPGPATDELRASPTTASTPPVAPPVAPITPVKFEPAPTPKLGSKPLPGMPPDPLAEPHPRLPQSKPLKDMVSAEHAPAKPPASKPLTPPTPPIEPDDTRPAPTLQPAKPEPVVVQPKAETAQIAPLANLEDSLDSLLRGAGDRKLEPHEIDAFWDDLASQAEGASQNDAEMISYEQAIKMGLAPKDAGK